MSRSAPPGSVASVSYTVTAGPSRDTEESARYTVSRDGSEVVAAATTLGKTLLNVTNLLEESAAEFSAINPDGSSRPEKYPLLEEEVTFGRANATYTFEGDRLMSRSHARVYHRGEDFFLEDLSSRNGTFVMVRGKAPVPFGAPVLVGKEMFRIVPVARPVS